MKGACIVAFLLVLFSWHRLAAQDVADTVAKKKEFIIEAEFRPRTEYRHGYRQLRPDTSDAAFFTDQRSRIYLTYKTKRFIFHTSLQDVRVWGGQDPTTIDGSVQIFETYVEPSLSDKFSVRI